MDKKLAQLIAAMARYDSGDAKRIQHFIKVHSFSAMLGKLEELDVETQRILEIAAVVHDIGIHVSEQKYGRCDGKLQEKEGPAEAAKLLRGLQLFTEAEIERACWLVGHHHTYNNIEGLDYQILVEADFLVNAYEDDLFDDAIETMKNKVFKTESGKMLLCEMFEHKYTLRK